MFNDESSLRELPFDELCQLIRPIVFKFMRQYHIHLWEVNDWEQEGMICLFRLIQDKPSCLDCRSLFFACFKTKFSSYLKDVLRSQESDKRRLNRLPYEEVSTLSHSISQGGLGIDEKIILKDQLLRLREQLPIQKKHLVELLLSGERFKGRSELLRQLRGLSEG
ncbi:sigma-70 family RNA polymerase sigma factor [Streptococcus jiangjianxini]|uniref:sigma-70 family RNA polymerase sigma factor n=1 Tax=Streptococcus jiangjianxini TaxID=3161189 RepID=UPI0032EB75FC